MPLTIAFFKYVLGLLNCTLNVNTKDWGLDLTCIMLGKNNNNKKKKHRIKMKRDLSVGVCMRVFVCGSGDVFSFQICS